MNQEFKQFSKKYNTELGFQDRPQGFQDAVAALQLLDDANKSDNEEAQKTASDNLVRAMRMMDLEEVDEKIYDHLGVLMKEAGKMSDIPEYKKAWEYELPEDKS
jgi:ribosome-interacting GTPase 1